MNEIAIIVNALGWALIHFLWQGLLVAGLMWLLVTAIPQHRSQLRYLGGLGLYFLLLPISINTFIFFFKSATAAPALLQLDIPMVSVASGVKPGLDFWLSEGIEPLLPLVVLLWLLGVSLLALRAVLGWVGTRFLVRRNVASISADLQRRVNHLIDRLNIRQAVSVLVSSRVKVPTVIGWIKPVILLPASVLARLPVEQLEMIIAHELGHIHRYDYLVNLLQIVIDTLFFYHPAVRWMSRNIRQEREHCCDDFVLKHQCRPSLYARALANLEVLRRPACATTLAATGGDLLRRVHRIASSDKSRKSAGFAQVAMMAALVALAGMGTHGGLEMGVYMPGHQLSARAVNPPFSFSGADHGRTAWTGTPDPYTQIRQGERNHARKKLELARQQALVVASRSDQPPVQKEAEAIPAEVVKHGPEDDVGLSGQQLASLGVTTGQPLPESNIDAQTGGSASLVVDHLQTQKKLRRATVKPMKTVSPRYPTYARSRAVEGWVKLSFTVDALGRARDIMVVAASPRKMFDRAAEKALRKWRFEILEGHDTGVALAQTFDFSMHPSDVRPTSRQRRCNTTGSNICGMSYRQESVEYFGAQNNRTEAANRN